MEPYSHNSTMWDFLIQLNDDTALELLPALIWLEVLMILGIAGNLLVVYVFFWRLRMCTQYFFFIWLAIFDLTCSAIALPLEMYDLRNHLIIQNLVPCRFMRTLNCYCALCSVFTLTAIAADRYRKVCHPMKPQITVKKAKFVLVVILVISVPFTVPAAVLFGIRKAEIKPYVGVYAHICAIDDTMENSSAPIIYTGSLIFVFCMTSLMLTFVYVRIWQMTKRLYLNMIENGIVNISPHSSEVSDSGKWLRLREILRRIKKPRENVTQTTFCQALQGFAPSLRFPTDSIFKESLHQSDSNTTHLIPVDALFADDTASEMSALTKSVSEGDLSKATCACSLKKDEPCSDAQPCPHHEADRRQNPSDTMREQSEQRHRDSGRPRRESVWPDVVGMIKHAGTESIDGVPDAVKIPESERFHQISQVFDDAISGVYSMVTDMYPSNNYPPILEHQTSVDEPIHYASDVNVDVSGVPSTEGDDAEGLRTLSPEPAPCHPQQTIGKEENLTRNRSTRDAVESVGGTGGQTWFCAQPGEASTSTDYHVCADPPVKTTTPTINTNSTSSRASSPDRSASTKTDKTRHQSLVTIMGNTLSLSTLPVLRVVSNSPQDSDDSVTNVVGQISMASSDPVKKLGHDKVTKTAVTITVVFLVSFVPCMILIAVSLLWLDFDISLRGAKLCLYHISIRSFFLHSVSNPIIYAAQNIKFRDECFQLVRRLGSFFKRDRFS